MSFHQLLSWNDLVGDMDLASDEAWELVYSPYHGEVVPTWMVTQMARFRMGVGANGE